MPTVGREPVRDIAPVFLPAFDTGLVVQYGDTVDAAVNRQVRELAASVAGLELPRVVDLVPPGAPCSPTTTRW